MEIIPGLKRERLAGRNIDRKASRMAPVAFSLLGYSLERVKDRKHYIGQYTALFYSM